MKHCLIGCGLIFIFCISCAFIPPAVADETTKGKSIQPILDSGQGKVLIKGDLISANLKNASLDAVLKDIEAQEKIWFKGREALLQEKISVDFAGLPLREGLKRILAGMNYMMLFDREGRLAGINILGKKTFDAAAQKTAVQAQPSADPPPVRAARSFPAGSEPPKLPRETTPGAKTAGGVGKNVRAAQAESRDREKDSEEIPREFKVTPGAAPPGKSRSAGLTESQAKKFEVIENAPPPGRPITSSPGAYGQSGTIQSSQPPGGPVKMTEQEKALFPTRKRTPPAP